MDADPRRYRRKSDGTVYRVVTQARSITGPVTLRAVEGPGEVETTNDRLMVDYEFFRVEEHAVAYSCEAKIPSPQELIDARRVSCADRVRELTTKVVEDLRASPTYTASARDIPEVLDGVRRNLVGAGWKCETRKGGARDGGATDELRVYPPCASCGGRGLFTEDPNTGRGGGPCSRCHGNGYVPPVGET